MSIEGTGCWKVRDLRPTNRLFCHPRPKVTGGPIVTVELATEPTTILACYRDGTVGRSLASVERKKMSTHSIARSVSGDRTRRARSCPGPGPSSADGSQLESKFAGSQDAIILDSLKCSSRAELTVQCQELLTGLTATLPG